MAEIKVPKIAGAELSIGRWFKRVGDRDRAGAFGRGRYG